MEIRLSGNPDYHPIMQADPCISSNTPSLGSSGELGHPCSIKIAAFYLKTLAACCIILLKECGLRCHSDVASNCPIQFIQLVHLSQWTFGVFILTNSRPIPVQMVSGWVPSNTMVGWYKMMPIRSCRIGEKLSETIHSLHWVFSVTNFGLK